jgi:transcriptional regulator
VPRLVEDHSRFATMLRELIDYYEGPWANRWSGEIPEEFRDKLMAGIVGVEIEITRLEGKYKLSQNRSDEDFTRVMSELASSGDQTEREVAKMMRRIDRPAK